MRQKLPLFVVVGFFIISILFTIDNPTSSASEQRKDFFPEIQPWELKSISLSDNAGNALFFERVMCVWTIGEDHQPTNEVKVSDLADSLIALSSSKVIGQGNAFFLPNRVDEKAYDLKVILGIGEKKQVIVFLGKGKETGTVFASLRENDDVHFVKGMDLDKIILKDQVWKVGS